MASASVIIPCYNHGHFLPDALDSVLAQTYTDWEAIVVNDGSTDNTAAVAERYADADARIRCIHQENAGLSAARNAGIRAAQGEYLAFLDADDTWEPAFLETCTAALEAHHGLAGVYTRCVFTDECGVALPMAGGPALGPERTRARLLRGGIAPVHAYLVRANAILRAGLFDESLTSLEDWDLWLRVTDQGQVAGLPQLLARYRLRLGSMVTNAERMHLNRLAVLAKFFGPLDGDPAVWPQDKRELVAKALFAGVPGFIIGGDTERGLALLAQAAAVWPGILVEPATHYELACWDQPWGLRGHAESLDFERSAEHMLSGLDALFEHSDGKLDPVRSAAYGQAYLAQAMLADQAGRWDLAKKHLALAVSSDPILLTQITVLRRGLKLLLGRQVAHIIRRCARGIFVCSRTRSQGLCRAPSVGTEEEPVE